MSVLDWLWLLTDAALFVGALFLALRDTRRIRWVPALVRRTFANFGWYALAVTALMIAGQAMSPSLTIYGAVLFGTILSGFHLLPMAAILFIALMVTLPVEQRHGVDRQHER